jgi:protein-S-isoprenylcysteine O-methyltransferase Ste14
LIFFSVLGVLAVLYVLHFRHRALSMGPESLRAALSRTVCEDEEATELELRQGAGELAARLQRALYAVSAILVAVLAVCLVLIAASTLPEVSLALSGFCVFLASLYICIVLLRDIPRRISGQLDKEQDSG